MVFDVSLEMQSDSKNYVSVQDDEITDLVQSQYKIGSRCLTQLEIFNELLQKASFEPNEKMRCLFGIAKRLSKLLWICSGRILQACAYHKIPLVFIGLLVRVSNRLNARHSKTKKN